ncbi:hypothetical protein NXS19_005542 [Fusarium pseudograminearum]|nr:hypothetical protein NXS19_005542 [Fusarium pseudograminearum]
MTTIEPGNHKAAMQRALGLANNSPKANQLSRYTLELPGNTHAEETCLMKLAEQYGTTEEKLSEVFNTPHALYTTVEPCFKRLSGKLPCVERVLRQKSWITQVYVGVQEPETFVGENTGRKTLEDAGIEIHHVSGLEEEILKVATAGHVKE